MSRVSKNLFLLGIFQEITKADATSVPLHSDYGRKTAGVYLNTAISILEESDRIFIMPMLKEMIFHLSLTYHLAYQTSLSETLLASELGYRRFTASN